jgi:hypothetical protein
MTKGFFLCAALLLTWALPIRAADMREQVFTIGADVNAKGEVVQTQLEAGTAKPIAAVLDLALKQWRFEPAQEDGKAVPAHTFIEAKLEAIPDDSGKYTLRISYVRHGPTWDRRLPPRYPADAIHLRETGIVAMAGIVQPDGKITITDTRSVIRGGRGRSSLKAAATDWFSRHAVTPETLGGHPVAAQIHVYIGFRLSDMARSRARPASGLPYSPKEKEALLQVGFKDRGDNTEIETPEISSVLQVRTVNPVTMHL